MKIEKILRIAGDRRIAIIGEGKIGKIVADYFILNNLEQFIKRGIFLVDDGYKKKELYCNIPIYEMTEFIEKGEVEEYLYLNTVTSIDSKIYKNYLVEKGINDIIDLNASEMAIKISTDYWLKYFHQRDISTDNQELRIGQFVFPNPFLNTVPKDTKYSFLADVRELIVPIWLDDYTKCDEGPYESKNVRIMNNDVVIDCGANIGISTANAIAKKCKKVYSFEPVMNDSLKKCKKLFGEKMTLCLQALSDYEGTAIIHINSEANDDNSIYHIQNTLNEMRTVEVTTVDVFCKNNNVEKVDFIKFYIDDLEGRMLLGAKEIIRRDTPKLAIFPCLPQNTMELKMKLEQIIKDINENYKVEYAWNKMFAYMEL